MRIKQIPIRKGAPKTERSHRFHQLLVWIPWETEDSQWCGELREPTDVWRPTSQTYHLALCENGAYCYANQWPSDLWDFSRIWGSLFSVKAQNQWQSAANPTWHSTVETGRWIFSTNQALKKSSLFFKSPIYYHEYYHAIVTMMIIDLLPWVQLGQWSCYSWTASSGQQIAGKVWYQW